jgi:hypothetical protein
MATPVKVAEEAITDRLADLKDTVTKTDRRARDLIEEYPMASLALAVGLGYLAARVLRR